MKDRIRQIMEYENMSQQEFSNRLGISPASLSSIYNGRTNPTNNHVQAIHKAFPEIDINWLLFGEGTMFQDDVPMGSELTDTPNLNTPDVATQSGAEIPDMFAAKGVSSPATVQNVAVHGAYPRHFRENMPDARVQERVMRKIKEIRVFYDDGTYESFAPAK